MLLCLLLVVDCCLSCSACLQKVSLCFCSCNLCKISHLLPDDWWQEMRYLICIVVNHISFTPLQRLALPNRTSAVCIAFICFCTSNCSDSSLRQLPLTVSPESTMIETYPPAPNQGDPIDCYVSCVANL